MWFNLAAAQGDSNAANGRDLMASIMNPTQIEKAQAARRRMDADDRPVIGRTPREDLLGHDG